MNDVSRRHWLGSVATLGVAAALAGTATAQGRPSADDLIRTVKGAKLFDLSFTWNEQSPVLGLNPPYSFALNRTHKMTHEIFGQAPGRGVLGVGDHVLQRSARFPVDLMVNRVVFVDVARQIAGGRPDPLPPGFEITGAHLEQTSKAQGVEVRRGDSLLIRTGWGQYFGKDNGKYLGEQSPGPGQDAARWIIDKGVRLAGDDTATFEKRPAAYGKELFSVHMMLLADHGI